MAVAKVSHRIGISVGMMKEKCRGDEVNVKRLGVVHLHLVFCARAPRGISVTNVPCLSGAEVETWGTLSSAAAEEADQEEKAGEVGTSARIWAPCSEMPALFWGAPCRD
jgi:hypothetical protein